MNKAHTLDARAKELAKNLLRTEGEVLITLMEMSRAKVFAELNYSGVFDYCVRALNFSREQSYYFKKVAEVSVVVPELKSAIVQGELSLSSARRIAPILNMTNQAEWIDKAKTMRQTDLEKAVTEVNPQAHPKERIRPVAKDISELRVAIDDQTDRDLTVLKDLLSQKLRRPATLADVIAWAARETREKFDPEKKALRAVTKVSTGNGPTAEVRQASGGALTSSSPKFVEGLPSVMHRRVPIPAAIKHEVVRRQGARCSFTSIDNRRCEERRWLECHHLKPVSRGGLNGVENLTFLCTRHHRAQHA